MLAGHDNASTRPGLQATRCSQAIACRWSSAHIGKPVRMLDAGWLAALDQQVRQLDRAPLVVDRLDAAEVADDELSPRGRQPDPAHPLDHGGAGASRQDPLDEGAPEIPRR